MSNKKGGTPMLITYSVSEKIRSKRGRQNLTKTEVANQLGVSRTTLGKIENGNYDAPKRIYESVMTWLVEEI